MRRLVLALGGVAAGMLLLAVPAIARHEQALHEREATQERAVMYELLPHHALRVPIAFDVQVARIVVRGFTRRAMLAKGAATLLVALEGPGGNRTEQLRIALATREPAAPSEDGEVTAGDRTTLNIDTADVGPGSVTLTLDELSGADGLLVRFYGRSALDEPQAQDRRRKLSARERQQLARRGAGLDWADLEPEARAALLETRWRKLAALPGPNGAPVWRVLTSSAPGGSERPAVPAAEPGQQLNDVSDTEQAAPHAAVDAIRLTPERDVVVEADDAPLLIRLRAGAPTSADSAHEPARLRVAIEAPGSMLRVFSAVGPHAHVLVPAHGRATIACESGAVDVALSELDPRATRRPVRLSDSDVSEPWHGFVARRPSNFATFGADAKAQLSLDEAGAESLGRHPFDPSLQRARPSRPHSVPALQHADRLYVAGTAQLDVDVPPSGAVLPLRLFSSDEVEVAILIDGEAPRRRSIGVPRFITTARQVRFRGDAAFGLVLGDDLEPGRHIVSLRYAASVKVWLHAPWQGRSHVPEQSAWLSAEVEP